MENLKNKTAGVNSKSLAMEALASKAENTQSLVLALVGDAVEALYFRIWFANNSDLKVNAITKKINSMVNAHAQAQCYKYLEHELSEKELEICRRARNTHTHSTAKNFSVIDYRYATAFEALLGFLKLSGQVGRIEYILDKIRNNFEEILNFKG